MGAGDERSGRGGERGAMKDMRASKRCEGREKVSNDVKHEKHCERDAREENNE